MALPIKPTPVLKADGAVKFLKKVEKNLAKPSYEVETPKLHLAKELATRYASRKSK